MGEDAFSLSYLHHSSAQVSKCTVDSRARVRTSRQLQTQFRDKRTSTLILLSQLARSAHRSCSAAIVPSLRQVLQKLHLNLHGHALLQLLHLPLHLQIQLHSTCTCAQPLIILHQCLYIVAWILLCSTSGFAPIRKKKTTRTTASDRKSNPFTCYFFPCLSKA